MKFKPGEVISAEKMNKLVEKIEVLEDGLAILEQMLKNLEETLCLGLENLRKQICLTPSDLVGDVDNPIEHDVEEDFFGRKV